MVVAFETVYGTAPTSGFFAVPLASTTLGAEQPLLASELLGQGRDPLRPTLDAVTADGDVVIPIDVENLGIWLKAVFGGPTTTGTTPKVHTFTSGSFALPSLSIERGFPAVPSFPMYTGVKADGLSFTAQRSGLLTATVSLIAQGETLSATTNAGTPTTRGFARFGNFNGAISRNGLALGNVMSAEVNYSNNLDRVETIRADGLIDGADETMATLTGSLTMRFADTTLITQAIAGDPCSLAFTYSLGANASFVFTAHAIYLNRPRIGVQGPGGIDVQFDWQAAKSASPARMCTAVLTNTVASY